MPNAQKLFSNEPPMPTAVDDLLARLTSEERIRYLMEDIANQARNIPIAEPTLPEFSKPEPGLMDGMPMNAMSMDTGLTQSPLDGSWSQYKKAPAKPGAYVGQRHGRG